MLKGQENVGKNLPTVPFREERIPFAAFGDPGEALWRYALMPYWTAEYGVMDFSFYNRAHFHSQAYQSEKKGIKFDSSSVRFLPSQVVPDTRTRIYLVRYQGNGQTIDCTQPVKILREYDRQQLVSAVIEQDGVIIRLVDQEALAREAESIQKIPYDVILQGQTVAGTEYGVIRFYKPGSRVCFINSYHADNKAHPHFKSKARSVLFAPSDITLLPEGLVLDTKSKVYLVNFSIQGSMTSPLNGDTFPTVDPQVPVTVVCSFSQKDCLIHCPQEDDVLVDVKQGQLPPPELASSIEVLRKTIWDRLSQADYVLTAPFPQMARDAGVSDYHLYADSVESFVKQYLPDFKVLKNIVLNGIRLPGIIVPQDFTVSKDQEPKPEEKSVDFSELDRLFQAGDFAGFLSCKTFTSTPFRELPEDVQQQALTCAARILYRAPTMEITMEPFERALFQAEKSEDFIKKWKIRGMFDQEILQSYARSSWAQYTLPEDSGRAAAELNDIGLIHTLNNSYNGLSERFGQCGSRLAPCLFLMRIMANPTPKTVKEVLSRYCQIVKALRPKLLFARPDDTKKLFCLEELVRAVHTLLPKIDFPYNLVTNLLSVFVDCNCVLRAPKTLEAVDPTHAAAEWEFLDLYQNTFTWTEDRLRALLRRGYFNRQLFQKIVALAWERYADKPDLPQPFLRLLGWICMWDDSFSVDEILRYHFLSGFTKREKQLQLLRSDSQICALAASLDMPMYALAAYIANVTAEDLNEDQIPPEAVESLSHMESLRQQVCQSVLQKTGPVSQENEPVYETLFHAFRFDFPVLNKIQQEYAQWYMQKPLQGCTAQELEAHLDHLNQCRAFEAYARVYALYMDLFPSTDISPRTVEMYIGALMQIRRFSEAVQYLRTRAPVPADTREVLQIRVLSENFRLNALDEQTFQVLDQAISWEEAHALLISHMGDNISIATQAVNCLMALYCHRKCYCRLAYLYKIYQSRAENGFTRLYSDIRSQVPWAASGMFKSHYDVISWAFSALGAKELLGFFQWLQNITIPDFKELKLENSLSFFYQFLIENPLDPKNWKTFLAHLTKRVGLNLWKIVVCEGILGTLSAEFTPTNTDLALSHMLDNSSPAQLPYNLLPYALSYLMETNSRSTELYEKLTEALSDPDMIQHLVQDNPWHPTYTKTIEQFQTYALQLFRQTGSAHYFKLLNVLPLALKNEDLLVISLQEHNMQRALVQLCQNYLAGDRQEESRQFLSKVSDQDFTPHERNMLTFLRLLFGEEEALLLKYPTLFKNENEVIRVKRDCAWILTDYPAKKKLRQFDQNCLGISHRLTVYALIFGILYDEDIYNSPQYIPESLDLADRRTRDAYLLFLQNTYLAQLDFNAAYDFFYKKWRYFKLLLTTILLNWGVDCDDGFILAAMRQYDHYDSIYRSDYQPFQQEVLTLIRIVPLTDRTKQDFLLALMVGQIGWFLKNHGDELAGLPMDAKEHTVQIIQRLDYRETSASFFTLYGQEILKGSAGLVLPVAQALSPRLVDAWDAFRQAASEGKDCTAILRIAQTDPPSACIKALLKLKAAVFTQYADVIAPIVFARQFPFQFYRKIREFLIRNHKNKGYLDQILAKFDVCCRYAARSDQTVPAVQAYLTGLGFCLMDQRAKAQESLAGLDLRADIPQAWQDEAQRMMAYLDGRQESFQPDWFDMDISQGSNLRATGLSFVSRLQKQLNIPAKELRKEEWNELHARYCSGTLSPKEHFQAGVTLLSNMPPLNRCSPKEAPLWEDLLLDVGLEALQPESGISAELQLTIASELLEITAGRGKAVAEKFEQLLENFRRIPYRGISLAGWAQHGDDIQKCLGLAGTGNVEDFARLNRQIIQRCAVLLGADHTNEERLEDYQKLLGQIKGFDKTEGYAQKVGEAIQTEIDRIASGIRLSICLDDQKAATDGYVYYQLSNVGKKTVQLHTKALRIWFQQDDYLRQELEFTGLNELRSQYVTGGRARLRLDGQPRTVSVEFWVERAEDGVLLCRAKKQHLPIAHCEQEFTVNDQHWYATHCAVNDADMLFGRDGDKDKLHAQLTHSDKVGGGLAVIYGPSRIGKTSLLNWVANDYAREKGNVIRVSFGGEGGQGGETDYKKSFIPSEYAQIPYENNQAMSEYLLSCTIRQALSDAMRSRCRLPESAPLPQNLGTSIKSILRNTSQSILERYHAVNELLRSAKLELWLLLDEFQQVVERWKTIARDCDFVQLCLALNYPGSGLTHIKLVICGSDDLLQHMVLEDNSVWRHAFKGSGITVDPLLKQPFSQMIQTDHGIAGANVQYSQKALDALYSYTGGVPLYGKEICNVILRDIDSRPEAYRGRNEIYVRDIAWATQTLLNLQDEELRADTREGIREIYEAVTKNLDTNTDKQYLWYMAWWLHNNPDKDSFPESEFTKHDLVEGETALKNSLAIAVARQILRISDSPDGMGSKSYTFRTIFYYCAFLGGVNLDKLHQDKIFLNESPEEEVPAQSGEPVIDQLYALFQSLPEEKQLFAAGGVIMSAKSAKVLQNLRDMAGDVIENQFQDKVIINVSVHQISNTINNILTTTNPREIQQSLHSLPRLDAYFAPDALPAVVEKLHSDDPECRAEAEAEIGTTMDQMSANYRTALAMQEEIPDKKPLWELLKIDSRLCKDLQRELDPSLMVDLYFAARLEDVFCRGMNAETGSEEDPIDYSPVTIMYCKTLEKALKLYHVDLYIQRLPKSQTQVKENNHPVLFRDLSNAELRKKVQNKIPIGAFLYPINPEHRTEEQYERIAGSRSQVKYWQRHGSMLLKVRGIRNDSAHGASGVLVTRQELMKLKDLLFTDEGLLNLVSLAN